LATITPMIEAIGASTLLLSPYSPDFNPIELWWSQLKSFLRGFVLWLWAILFALFPSLNF
jgi:transposase